MIETRRKDVFALVLAAGSASRFGATKQLREFDGVPLVRRAGDAAAELCGSRTVLVVGHDWQAVADAGMPAGGFLVRNEAYGEGMGTSLALGVRAVRHAAGAVLVILADQPLVTAGHLRDVVTAWSGGANEIVATVFDESAGPPVLFGRGCFDELAVLDGDRGGKHLLHDARFRLQTIPFEPAAIDIDTEDDLRRIARSARS